MKISVAILFSLITSIFVAQSYWQQEVNYKIDVKLNDKEHTISAFESFEYINHSPNDLDFIYVHLWANAYKNSKTALGKQLYPGNKLLKFGNDSLKGWIDSLDFKVDNQKVKWELDSKNIDICKIYLNTPLKSGQKMTVSTPFKVKIPSGEISRLGHVGQSYQITQWYPKPAVYDKNGWNQMPYLNQGEFYSEYGTFDVSITLPKNYIVGATGDLQTKSEIDFLIERNKQTLEKYNLGEFKAAKEKGTAGIFPVSDTEYKTIRYIQKDVHDFAWFADKRYEVLKGEVELPHSKNKVTTWALFTPQNAMVWENALEYLHDGTYYYSLWNGDYPYKQVTAVDGTISAGGGMEYPNVTVIGNASSKMMLEIVIVHEVGHNWFYGILGSNERVHGWMDEGMNTLNEMRYVETKYPDNKQFSDMVLNGKFHFENLSHYDMGDIGYRTIAILGEDQPLETHSADFTSMNYGLIMYQKTGLVFHYLKYYLGEKEFEKAMHAYFETWKFKHPQPEDMRESIEKSSGKKLDWLFKDLIQTTNHIDYKIKRVKNSENGSSLVIKNNGQVKGPIPVTAYGKDKMETKWIEPQNSNKSQLDFSFKVDSVQIDPNRQIPELDRTNNNWQKKWLFNKIEPLKFEFLIGQNEKKQSNNFWMPIIAGNSADKLMLGLVFHNYAVPFNKFQYIIAPMYSVGRNNLSGFAEMSFTALPKRNFKMIRTGVSTKTFKIDEYFRENESYYVSTSPYVFFKLGNRKNASPFSETILLQSMYRYDQVGNVKIEQVGGIFKYNMSVLKPDFHFLAEFRSDYVNNINNSNEMLRFMGETTLRFKYIKKKSDRWIDLRFYAGQIAKRKLELDLNKPLNFSALNREWSAYELSMNGTSGQQDVFIENYYFSRTTSGFGYNQRGENMGNFKTSGNFGRSTRFLASSNLFMQLPVGPKIIGIFADYGIFDNVNSIESMYNIGLGLRLGNVFGLYFPVIMSKNLNDSFGKAYIEKIRFSLKLNFVNQGLKIANLF